MAPQMKAFTSAQDGLDNLFLTDIPVPVAGSGEVLVKIHTIALNYRDTEVVMGLYNHHSKLGSDKPLPTIVPCSDMCGTVVSLGSDVQQWKEGDKVLSTFNQSHLSGTITQKDMASGLGLPLTGVLSEYRAFPAESLVRKPEGLSDEEACTLPIAGLTAWMALNGFNPLGQWLGKNGTEDAKKTIVLIQGTGGVAVMGLLLAKAAGATVIITSSSDSKLERARNLGADYTINYKTTPKWDEEVLKITNGNGADIIFENGGAKTLRQSFECVAFGGLINCIGYLSGKTDDPEDRTNTNVLALKRNVTLKGLLNGPKDRLEELVSFVEEKGVKPVVDRVWAFKEAKEALKYIFEGGHFGKVVIKVE
ncbi:oxidoreductase [Delitschia confertaspora ATCC 74209]|uniref:Oxidoreductase n=1 Tax=Delitschia confertaspora ATCC 74209 TaxID=1513339 RepID=A0A9P4JDU1_9PLEO|nr:oxidoreductase [Delitschia confertaspora ATCC 74209]